MIYKQTRARFTKIVAGSLVLFFALFVAYAPVLPLNTNEAQAIAVVETGANLAVNSAAAKTVALSSFYDSTIEPMLNGLAWTAAKVAVQSITQSTVNWINSGFEGSPAFVTDLNRNLSSLADTVADDFIRQLDIVAYENTGFSIRAPFQDQIAAQLREEFYRTTSSYGFNVRNPYTLGNYSNNPAAFTQGDFRQGGWSAWLASSKAENNPYGRYLLARNELFRQVDAQVETRVNELAWGNGFLSWRGPCGPNARPATASSTVALAQRDNTVGCSIRTPGAVIEDQLATTLGSGIRQLELADSVNEIVGALMGQLVNQVLGGTGLTGVSRPAAGGGQSYLDRATNASQYSATNSSLADGFAQEVAKQRQVIETYRTSWQRIAGAASAAEQACRTGFGTTTNLSEARRVLDLANTNVTRATNAIASIAALEGRIATARNSGANQSSNITAVVSEYQALLSATTVPTSVDAEQAALEARDTGTEEPGSLYSQMQRLARECR